MGPSLFPRSSLFLSFFFLSIFLADLDVKLIFRCESSFCFPGIGRSGGRGKGGEGGREFFEFYGIFMGSLWDLNIFWNVHFGTRVEWIFNGILKDFRKKFSEIWMMFPGDLYGIFTGSFKDLFRIWK